MNESNTENNIVTPLVNPPIVRNSSSKKRSISTRQRRVNIDDINNELNKHKSVAMSKKDAKKIRPPSYTDRILIHSLEDRRDRIVIQAYDLCDNMRVSDHRAVCMTLLLETNSSVIFTENALPKYRKKRTGLSLEIFELSILQLTVRLGKNDRTEEDDENDDDDETEVDINHDDINEDEIYLDRNSILESNMIAKNSLNISSPISNSNSTANAIKNTNEIHLISPIKQPKRKSRKSLLQLPLYEPHLTVSTSPSSSPIDSPKSSPKTRAKSRITNKPGLFLPITIDAAPESSNSIENAWRKKVEEEERKRLNKRNAVLAYRVKKNLSKKLRKIKSNKKFDKVISDVTVIFPLTSKDPLIMHRKIYDLSEALQVNSSELLT